MFRPIKVNAYENSECSKAIVSLNRYFFNTNEGLSYFTGVRSERLDYVSEASIKTAKDEAKLIMNWLHRIQRYFVVDPTLQGEDSKGQTAKHIIHFITRLNDLSDEALAFLLKNPHSQNLVCMSLLMTSDADAWNQALALLDTHAPDAIELQATLEWAYTYYFDKEKQDMPNTKLLELFIDQFPESPLSHLVQFYIHFRTYSRYFEHTLDNENHTKVHMVHGVLKHAIFVREYSNNNLNAVAVFTRLNEQYIALLASHFQSNWLRSAPFRTCFEYLMIHSLCTITSQSMITHLIHLKDILSKSTTLSYDFIKNLECYGNALPLLLFKLNEFAHAKAAYETLHFAFGKRDKTKDITYQMLCFCCELDHWLAHGEQPPKVTKIFCTKNTSITSDYQALIVPALYSLGMKLAQFSCKQKIQTLIDQAEAYYNLFKNQLTKTQQKQIEDILYKEKIKQIQKNQQRLIKETSQGKSKKKSVPVKKPTPDIFEEEVLPIEPPLRQLSVFKPVTSKPLLSRNKFSSSFLNTLDLLQNAFTSCTFVITGFAVENLLSGNMIPNDYDVLMIAPQTASVYHIQQKLSDCTIRSNTTPVAFYAPKDSPPIEFRVYDKTLKQNLNELLYQDYKKRDHNVSSLYAIINSESQWPVFSFDKALEHRNNKCISTNQPPEQLYAEDPTRLFRLMHLMLCCKEFELEPTLEESLHRLSPTWLDLFSEYLQKDSGNSKRLKYAIDKLLQRYKKMELHDVCNALAFPVALDELAESIDVVSKTGTSDIAFKI